jgi:hypothetical protein
MIKTGRSARIAVCLAAASLSFAVMAWPQEAPTGNEILAQVEMQGAQEDGRFAAVMVTETVYPDGTDSSVTTAVFIHSVPDVSAFMLLYILEPELERGFTVLVRSFEGEDAEVYLLLPVIGEPKQLDAEGQEGSFAGTTFTYGDFAGGDLVDDYTAEILREEPVTIGDAVRQTYVLRLTARPDADVEHPEATIWVDREEFILLRGEYSNESGNLEQRFEAMALGEFEGNLITDQFVQEEVLSGKRDTTTFTTRMRVSDLPDDVFLPENLTSFDPAEWGL